MRKFEKVLVSALAVGTLAAASPAIIASAEYNMPSMLAGNQTIGASSSDLFTFSYDTSSGEAKITKFSGKETEIVVPDFMVDENGNSYPVTTIAQNAFGNSKIKSVVIGNNVKTIEANAFLNCASLTSVTLPENIQSIGAKAFSSCKLLSQINLPNSITSMGEGVFTGCSSLTRITFPSGMNNIPASCFSGCTSLSYAFIPDSVTTINRSAFQNCSKLTDLTLPSYLGMTKVDSTAFNGCATPYLLYEKDITGKNLAIKGVYGSAQIIELPSEIDGMPVIAISASAFAGNNTITKVVIDEGIATIGKGAFTNAKKLEQVIMPSTVTIISESAFEGCSTLQTAPLHNRIIEIGAKAFYNCSSLSDVTIHDSISRIGKEAFYGCSSITEIVLPNSITFVDEFAFRKCANLEKITLSESLRTIKKGTFAQCINLKSIEFPENITEIEDGKTTSSIKSTSTVTTLNGDGAFSDCRSLTSVTFHKKFKKIGGVAFSDCLNIRSISLPEGLEYIGDLAFSGNSLLDNVVIPKSITVLNRGVFSHCESLRSVTVPKSVVTLGNGTGIATTSKRNDGTFGGCTSLEKIELPGVVSIGNYAFSECPALTEVKTVNNVIEYIGDYAFRDCTSMQNIAVYNSVASIGKGAFKGCTSLVKFVFPTNGKFTKINQDTLAQCSALTSVTIPKNVTSIVAGQKVSAKSGSTEVFGDGAFSDCVKLEAITIPDSITLIGKAAFSGCHSLKQITIPKTTKTIGDYAFFDCRAMTKVNLGNGVETIGKHAFENNMTLPEITIPTSIKNIGDGALSACTGMKKLIVEGDILSKNFYKRVVKTHSKECLALYSNDDGLIKENIETFDVRSPIKTIGESAFAGAKSAKKIIIGNTVETIGDSAFNGCTSLEVISTIPKNVTALGANAFESCTNLRAIVIPATVTQIGNKAFAGCTDLVIYGKSGSAAEEYVKNDNENIEFVNVYFEISILSAKQSADGTVSLTWTEFPTTGDHQITYYIYRAEGSGAMTKIAESSTPSYKDTSAVAGKTYRYCVAGYNETIEILSETSEPVTVVKLAVSSVVGDKQVQLSWNSIGSGAQYRVQRLKDSKWSTVKTTTSATFTEKNLTNGTSYKYRVLAYIDGKIVDTSAVITAVPKINTAPQNVKAVSSDKRVTLTWSAVANASEYCVQRLSGSTWKTVGKTKATTFANSGLTNGSKYSYRVLAVINGKYGTASAVVSATPQVNTVPQNVKAVAGDKRVTLTWSAVSGATQYRIQRKSGSSSWTSVKTVSTLSFVNTGLTNGTAYSYRVLSLINGKIAGVSAAVTAKPSAVPQNVKATAGDKQIKLTWTTVAGATQYRVQRKNGSTWVTVGSPKTNSFVNRGLTNGTSYSYRVLSYVNGQWSAASAVVSAKPINNTPSRVKAISGSKQITVSWDAVSGATQYRVQRKNDASWSTIATTKSTSYVNTGLTAGTTYSYRVLACVNGVWGGASEVASAAPRA